MPSDKKSAICCECKQEGIYAFDRMMAQARLEQAKTARDVLKGLNHTYNGLLDLQTALYFSEEAVAELERLAGRGK